MCTREVLQFKSSRLPQRCRQEFENKRDEEKERKPTVKFKSLTRDPQDCSGDR